MILNLYTKDAQSKVFTLDKKHYITEGTVGGVYRNDDRCFKHLLHHNRWQVNLIIKLLEDIKGIQNNNLCQIFDLYYKNNLDQTSLAGYEMLYYQPEDIDILNGSMRYLLDNFLDLMVLARKLALKGICIDDLHSDNVILQSNRIVVIDVDGYHFETLPYQEILVENYKQLKLLLRGLLLEQLRTKKYSESLYQYRKSFQLLKYDNNVSIDFIMQELDKYKTPIEFIRNYK